MITNNSNLVGLHGEMYFTRVINCNCLLFSDNRLENISGRGTSYKTTINVLGVLRVFYTTYMQTMQPAIQGRIVYYVKNLVNFFYIVTCDTSLRRLILAVIDCLAFTSFAVHLYITINVPTEVKLFQ